MFCYCMVSLPMLQPGSLGECSISILSIWHCTTVGCGWFQVMHTLVHKQTSPAARVYGHLCVSVWGGCVLICALCLSVFVSLWANMLGLCFFSTMYTNPKVHLPKTLATYGHGCGSCVSRVSRS